MTDPDEVLAQLSEARRYANMAAESLQSAKESSANRESMIMMADELLKQAIAVIARLARSAT
jgi:hypothetical protein